MHDSDCSTEPLAWAGVDVMVHHIGLHPSFRMVLWMHMIIKKNLTTLPQVQFIQSFPHSGYLKSRGLDSPHYFPFILYSPEAIWSQWILYSTVQVSSVFNEIINLLNKKHIQLLFFFYLNACSYVFSDVQLCVCKDGKDRLGENQLFLKFMCNMLRDHQEKN